MILARHRLVGVAFTLTMLLYVDRIAISAGKSAVAQQFALSDTQFGWVLSAFALGYALFQVPAGMFVDRFGPRLALTLVVGAWSLFTGLTGLVGLVPWVGPLVLKVLAIPFLWLMNGVGYFAAIFLAQQGHGKAVVDSRILTYVLLIGIVIGYILGKLI